MNSHAEYVRRHSPSLDAFEETMSGLLRPCSITKKTSKTYRTEVRHGRMNRVGLTAVSIGGSANIAVNAHRSLTLLQIPLQGSFSSFNTRYDRHIYSADTSAQLVHATSPMHLEFSASTRMLIIDLNDEQLNLLGGARLFREVIGHEGAVSIDRGTGLALVRLAKFIMGEIEASKETFFDIALAERLEDCLLAAISAAIGERDSKSEVGRPLPSYIRKAERFMLENMDQPITLAEIVAAVGTSARTLHRTFREVRGETPLGVLKNMRLDRVHQELLSGKIASGDITRLAMSFGFNHMGLFSADYKARFGVLPSALARQLRS